MSIAQTIRRLARLSRAHRIAHLKAIIQTLPPRSIRRQDLEEYLCDEVTKQIRKECAA